MTSVLLKVGDFIEKNCDKFLGLFSGESEHSVKYGLAIIPFGISQSSASLIITKFVKVFLGSLLVASIVALLHGWHLIEWSEVQSFKLAMTMPWAKKSASENILAEPKLHVFTISDKMYETQFNQTSPLDRTKLHKILERILALNPSVLAIDLDLSPTINELAESKCDIRQPSNESSHSAYKALESSLTKAVENSRTEIVLIHPIPVAEKCIQLMKLDWIRKMNKAGIQFALPDIHAVYGTVLTYDKRLPSLGVEAHRYHQEHGQGQCDLQANNLCVDENGYEYIEKNQDTLSKYLFWKNSNTAKKPKYTKINFEFVNNFNSYRIDDLADDGSLILNSYSDEMKNTMIGDVVFLGGDYGISDQYQTVVGQVGGIYIHAAVAYSMKQPIKDISQKKFFSYLVEIVMGVILGYSIEVLWHWYKGNKSLISMLINLAFPFLMMLLFIAIAAVILKCDMWVAPGSMIVGMLIHTAMTRSWEQPDENNKLQPSGLVVSEFDSISNSKTYVLNSRNNISDYTTPKKEKSFCNKLDVFLKTVAYFAIVISAICMIFTTH